MTLGLGQGCKDVRGRDEKSWNWMKVASEKDERSSAVIDIGHEVC